MTGTSSEFTEKEKPSILSKLGDFIFGFIAGTMFWSAIILAWWQF